ncbi:MAG: zinc ABC transporter substrate-binding protein [Candidatus Fermentibacteraceae bacterium]
MKSFLASVAVILALTASCGNPPRHSDGKLAVFVSIVPQKQFVERIAGDLVDVTVMVEAGSDPHTYEPRPAQMAGLQYASLYFTIGVPFEDVWMERIASSNTGMRIVDSAAGITRVVRVEGHEHGHEHHEGALDPHIWLAPGLVKIQAGNICSALQQIDPANSDVYADNLEAFLAELDLLSAGIRSHLEMSGTTEFLVFHPAWGYFADEFGLEMMSVEQGGQEPSPSELAEIINLARERGITVVFAQPEFSTDAADVIAREMGGSVVLVSPLSLDWAGSMRQIAETLAGVPYE